MKLHATFIMLLLLVSCGDGADPPPDEPQLTAPFNIDLRDVANWGDERDLELSFEKPSDLSLVEEFRLYLVKSEDAETFDNETALQLDSDSYISMNISASSNQVMFEDGFIDIDGDVIVEGMEYTFFILAIGIDDLGSVLSLPSNSLQLAQKTAVRTLTGSINAGSGGMDVDDDGNIYMADFGATTGGPPGTRVLKITSTGEVSTFASGLNGASGNDFDNKGNLFQSNINGGSNSLSKIAPDGTVTTFATGFTNPVGVVFDGTSKFYVCNCGNNTISEVDQDGTVALFSTSSLFNCPNGIDIDNSGNLYVANFGNGTIVKVDPSGTASAFATIPGNNMGHLLIRGSVIYVVARGLNSIYRVSLQGQVTKFAGTGARGLENGSLNQATFSLPNDMAFSPDGSRIYINDVDGSDPDATIIKPVVIREIHIVN